MSLFEIFEKRCASCPSQAPTCSCPETQTCQIIAQSCAKCSFAQCLDKTTSKSSSGGVSKGALAGGVVGVILFLFIAVALFFWNRRRLQRQRALLNIDQKPDVPAPAELVLNRPDPNEKPQSPIPFSSTGFLQQHHFQEQQGMPPVESVRVYNNTNSTSSSTINLDPFSQQDAHRQSVPGNGIRNQTHRISETSNPFTDHQSIVTASDSMQSDDVIPIALVPHTSAANIGTGAVGGAAGNTQSPRSSTLQSTSTGSSGSTPSRPPRAPDLNIRLNQGDPKGYDLEHVNVSQDSFRPPQMPFQSRGDGASDRTSWYTQASGTSAFSEAPQIAFVKPLTMRGAPVVRAAMVKAPGSPSASTLSANSKQQAMKSRASKASARSPLAQSGFTADMSPETESDEHGQEIEMPPLPGVGNPFGDDQYPNSSNLHVDLHSPMSVGSPSEAALPTGTSRDGGFANVYDHIGSNYNGRPLSDATQAGSLISPGDVNIASATRVQVVGPSPLRGVAAEATSKANRLTHGRLVASPSTSPQSTPLPSASTGTAPSMPGFMRSPAASSVMSNTMQDQQAHALAVARAKASVLSHHSISRDSTMSGMSDASLDPPSRISYGGSYRSSTASAGGDSLLESFTFVPPSPIASRPPRSPLSQKSPSAGSPLAGSSMQDQQQRAREVLMQQQQQLRERERLERERLEREADMELDGHSDAISRRTQALSTISHASGTSALDGYAFHIESPLMPYRHGGATGSISSQSAFSPANIDVNADGMVTPTMPGTPTGTSTPIAISPTTTVGGKSVRNRQRASLDTLALTQDLSAFPLNFSG